MTSKNSFWKLSVWNFKRRSWVMALISTVWFFLLPVFTFIGVQEIVEEYKGFMEGKQELLQLAGTASYMDGVQREIMYLVFNAGIILIIPTTIFAVFMALQGSAWMNKRQKVDLYKSIPVKETTRFCYIHLNSYLMYISSLTVCLIASNIIIAGFHYYHIAFLQCSLYFILIGSMTFIATYMLTLIAQLLTGNVVLGFFGALFFLFVEPALRFIVYALKYTFFKTTDDTLGRAVFYDSCLTSPFMSGLSNSYSGIFDGYGVYHVGITPKLIICLLLQMIVYTAIAFLLYIKRPSQIGDRKIVFKKAIPYIKIAIMVTGSLFVSIMMCEALWRQPLAYGLFGLIAASVVLHFVLGAMMDDSKEKIIKRNIQNLPTSLLATGIAALIFLIFALDFAHYDTYLPRIDKLDGFTIRCMNDSNYYYLLEEYRSDAYIKDENAKKVLLSVVKNAMQKNDYAIWDNDGSAMTDVVCVKDELGIDSDWTYEDGTNQYTVLVEYQLTNHKSVKRKYTLRRTDYRKILAACYNLKEYKDMTTPIDTAAFKDAVENPDYETRLVFENYDFDTIADYDGTAKAREDLSKEEKNEIIQTLKEDLYDRTYADYIESKPIGLVWIECRKGTVGKYLNSTMFEYPIPYYSCDEKTIALLTELGIYKDVSLDQNKVERIQVFKMVSYEDKADEQYCLTVDPNSHLGKELLENCYATRSIANASDAEFWKKQSYFMNIISKDGKSVQYFINQHGCPAELEDAMKDATLQTNWSYEEVAY